MFAFTRLNPGEVFLHSNQVLLRSHDYQQQVTADELLLQAQEQAQALSLQTREVHEEHKRLGWQAGMEEVAAQQAELIHLTVLQCKQLYQQVEERLVGVVMQAVRRLVAECPAQERIANATRDGLALLGDGARVALHVHPQDVSAARDAMALLQGDTGHIEVVATPSVQPGECILESEMGSVDLGIETQLRALEAALGQSRSNPCAI